jgi:hypothetical protein
MEGTAVMSSILQQLSVGAMITINQASRQIYVTSLNSPQGPVNVLASGTPGPSANNIFIVTMYSFNGTNEAKISLQPNKMAGNFWMPGENVVGLSLPIVVGPAAGQFLLTDTGQGLTIQNTFAPPGPYIHGYEPSVIGLLTYGHDQPLIQGLFAISVVG